MEILSVDLKYKNNVWNYKSIFILISFNFYLLLQGIATSTNYTLESVSHKEIHGILT